MGTIIGDYIGTIHSLLRTRQLLGRRRFLEGSCKSLSRAGVQGLGSNRQEPGVPQPAFLHISDLRDPNEALKLKSPMRKPEYRLGCLRLQGLRFEGFKV